MRARQGTELRVSDQRTEFARRQKHSACVAAAQSRAGRGQNSSDVTCPLPSWKSPNGCIRIFGNDLGAGCLMACLKLSQGRSSGTTNPQPTVSQLA